jgi:DNA-binding transcriptional MerR regulator
MSRDDQIIDIEPEGREMKDTVPAEVAAIDEAYGLGRKEADRAVTLLESEGLEREAAGKIKAAEFNIKSNELLMYVTLYQVKETKAYKKAGRTWEQFCAMIGKQQRTVDRILSELTPLLEGISATQAEILGMPLSKIRYLGRSVSANLAEISGNAILIGDQKIEITPENKDDIEAAIDLLKEEADKERDKHAKELERLKKRTEGAVKEETLNLTTERDALVKELKRLKVFDPEGKDRSWSVEQIKRIKDSCTEFTLLCSKFILDERLDGDVELQAEVEKWMSIARHTLDDLWERWGQRFDAGFGE